MGIEKSDDERGSKIMTDHQVQLIAAAIASGIPTLAVLLGVLSNNRNTDSLRREFTARLDGFEQQITAQFEASRQALLRVEGVLDARLKHVEEKIG